MILTVFLLVLTGCSSETNKSASADQKDPTVSYKNHFGKSDDIKAEATNKHQDQSNKLWNKTKDKQLEDFINQWAPTMHQAYTKYDGVHQLENSVRLKYPRDLDRQLVNEKRHAIGWSETGDGPYEYNVVAIYNYNKEVPPFPGRITYLFAFRHGQPVALVDESRDGEPRAVETQNLDVKNNFARIATESNSN